jgi:hypothetical protein
MSKLGKELEKIADHNNDSIPAVFGLESRDDELRQAFEEVKLAGFEVYTTGANPVDTMVSGIVERYGDDPKAAVTLACILARGMPFDVDHVPVVEEIKQAVYGTSRYSESLVEGLKALPEGATIEDHVRAALLIGKNAQRWATDGDADPLMALLRHMSE